MAIACNWNTKSSCGTLVGQLPYCTCQGDSIVCGGEAKLNLSLTCWLMLVSKCLSKSHQEYFVGKTKKGVREWLMGSRWHVVTLSLNHGCGLSSVRMIGVQMCLSLPHPLSGMQSSPLRPSAWVCESKYNEVFSVCRCLLCQMLNLSVHWSVHQIAGTCLWETIANSHILANGISLLLFGL